MVNGSSRNVVARPDDRPTAHPAPGGPTPRLARHRACPARPSHPTTVVVYQAYRPEIAEHGVRYQRFDGPFSLDRMRWVKPGFLWMMYRSVGPASPVRSASWPSGCPGRHSSRSCPLPPW
ncbi:MAG TPA: DUF4291 family protein [Mycobacteriales bacterium]